MRRHLLPLFALLPAVVAVVAADDPLPRLKPLDPADALTAFDVRPGFRVELAAAEPLVRDPVAVDFDEDGRLFVAEFPEYNQYANPTPPPARGCVKLLTDADGDGRFDAATVYAADLDAPVAVACWDGGVFVGVVPDLWYFKDTDGDGKADVRTKVLTGFEKDRAGEAMLNSFRWTLDNRFVIATGLAGGDLRPAGDPSAKPLPARRQNVRFDPRTGRLEPTSGGGQHGLTLDDWNDTFVCDNSNPIRHLSYDGRYLPRNPFAEAPSPLADVNAAGKFPNLHRVSPPEPWREARTRLRATKAVPGSDEGGKPFGFFTGATGVTVYRGDAWPAEFRGDIFVGEVANNLVYRAKPKAKGLGWSAERAEAGREFLASRDVWFRPVQFANAPDGNLYVVDMYRELIEGAAFLPPQLLKHVDIAGGIDRGRVYRIAAGTARHPAPRLSRATTAELVALLAHPNGWHRDTAARLLYQRQDRAAVGPLRKLASAGDAGLTRTHALYALAGLGALTPKDVWLAFYDVDAKAREHAVRLAEPVAAEHDVAIALAALASDPDPRVRFQLAWSAASLPADQCREVLAKLARRDGAEPLVRTAVLVSARDVAGPLFADLLADAGFRTSSAGKALLPALAAQIGAAGRPAELAAVATAVDALPPADAALAAALVRGLVAKLPSAARSRLGWAKGGKAASVLADLLAAAKKTAADEAAAPAARADAVRTLALARFADAKDVFAACLDVRQPPPVQSAALETLARFDDPAVPAVVLAAWPGLTPAARATAAETLFARPAGVSAFLDAVAAGKVRPADLDPARVQVLLKSADPAVRSRAEKLLAGAGLSKRADVIAKYQPALTLAGDAARGKLAFKNVCSACHKLEGVGNAVGPDLSAIKNRGSEAVLTNVLDPNREVLPQYFTYLLTTDDGATVTGLIVAETANTLTLRRADGTTATVQRVNVDALRSTGLSAMPEGLEQQLDVQGMADLLAYLNGIK